MAQTPSSRRREGRNAFDSQCSDSDRDGLNPYLPAKTWRQAIKADDWMDGWKEAEERHYEPPETNIICPYCKQPID